MRRLNPEQGSGWRTVHKVVTTAESILAVPDDIAVNWAIMQAVVDGWLISSHIQGAIEGNAGSIVPLVTGLGATRFLRWVYSNIGTNIRRID